MSDTNNKKNNVSDLRESLQHREAEIDLLQRTFTEIGSELDLDNLFQLIAERACELVKAETLLIPVLDVNCETYTYRASAGVNSDEIVGEALPLDFGVCGWVWRHKKAWWRGVLGDLSEDERNRWEKEAGSLILVPLQGKNHFLGGISAINKVGHHEFTRRFQSAEHVCRYRFCCYRKCDGCAANGANQPHERGLSPPSEDHEQAIARKQPRAGISRAL